MADQDVRTNTQARKLVKVRKRRELSLIQKETKRIVQFFKSAAQYFQGNDELGEEITRAIAVASKIPPLSKQLQAEDVDPQELIQAWSTTKEATERVRLLIEEGL